MLKIAFALIGIGLLVLIGWSVRYFFMSSDIHLVIRIAVGIIGLGLLIIIGVVIREQLIKSKTDKYKEIDR